jgi:hypothetical protein
MRTVPIADDVRAIVDRHVAAGDAATEADFVAEGVRRYADALDDDTDAVLAAAQQGIEAIERGDYITIANETDRAAFWAQVDVQVETLVRRLRGEEASNAVDQPAIEPQV